ncbi:hypothetical protein VNI00_015846 [Paramarasmius palmivorus]|uniref:Uncharacterized protein n=1 Tax=Paramarasmius palmivorus TaxID=297713 RepID=A0AAW0BJB4_9AGAR
MCSDNDFDGIELSGFKLHGETQTRSPEELRKYLFLRTGHGHGLVPIAAVYPFTRARQRQLPLPASQAIPEETSEATSSSDVQEQLPEPTQTQSSENDILLASSSTMSSEPFDSTQERSECSQSIKHGVGLGSDDGFMCISQYRRKNPHRRCSSRMDRCKIAVLGDGGVGKTALAVQQFTLDCFIGENLNLLLSSSPKSMAIPFSTETYDPTIEDAFLKHLNIDGRMCAVEIIDTAGQEEFATLRDQWIREAEAFVIVYSVTSENSFRGVEKFWQAIHRVKKSPPFILVGNKMDQTLQREVKESEGASLARIYGCEHVETSAKTSQNILYPFVRLVSDIRVKRGEMETLLKDDTSKKMERTGCGGCAIM